MSSDPDLARLRRVAMLKYLERQQAPRVAPIPGIALQPRGDAGPVPLSWAQQRLWFLHQLNPAASVAYHIPVGLRLLGRLDRPALKAAFKRIIERHEALRTAFKMVEGKAVQVIEAAEVSFHLHEHDLADLTPEEQQAAVSRLSEDIAARAFDFDGEPLMRVGLLRLDEEQHMLLVNQHHIASDGWSLGVLAQELIALYKAFSAGRPDPLPALPVQYADYVLWQRQWLQGEVLERQLAFWREHLRGAPVLIELPTDRQRPLEQSYAGGTICLQPAGELNTALRQFCHRQGVTVFMALLAAWAVLLSRLSGQDDIVVGTPVANRKRKEVEGLIGYFANTLALRVRLESDPTVSELMARIKTATLDAYTHQDLPFERVVEALQPPRSLSHNPLFQVMLVFNNTPNRGELRMPGLRLEPATLQESNTHFDLTLSLTDRGDMLYGWLTYASDLFDRATAERIAAQFQLVLAGLIADDRRPISRIPLLGPTEREQVLPRFNPPVPTRSTDGLIHLLFEKQVNAHPQAIAVQFEGRSLPYDELNRRANQVAHRLLQLGVRPDDRVALCVERSLEMIIGLLGILKAGAGYVPLDPASPPERLSYILEDSTPRALLTQSVLQKLLPAHGIAMVLLDGEDVELQAQPDGNPDATKSGLTPNHIAYVIYTSGTTGKPKGVIIEHRNVTHLLAVAEQRFAFGRDDVWPLFHSFAFDVSVWELWGALTFGGRLIVIPQSLARSPADFYALLCHERVTVLNQTPSAFRQLAAAAAESRERHCLRYIVFAGEALEMPTLRPWVARNPLDRTSLINMYGITEITVHATYRKLSQADIEAGTSVVGAAIPGLNIYLLDRHLQPVPVGVRGEIYVSGRGVARSYLNRPELTAERFLHDPFGADPAVRMYKSGDLGRWLPDGTIEYLGRNDTQIKLRGFRIEPGEIEARLLAHPQVREAVVVAREAAQGKRLIGYVTGTGEGDIEGRLRAHLEASLPDYMVPARIVVLESLPLTLNGKLDKRALPEPEWSGKEYVAPGTELEQQLAAIWQSVLEVPQVGVTDNFFELGGDSFEAVKVLSIIRARKLGRLSVSSLFSAATVRNLARRIEGEQASSPNIVHLKQGAGKPPIYCVPPFYGKVGGYVDLANGLPAGHAVIGLQARWLTDTQNLEESIEEIAAANARYIEENDPGVGCFIVGFSWGGIIAYEMARRLARTVPVHFVGMIDVHYFSADSEGSEHLTPQRRRDLQDRLLEWIGQSALKHLWTKLLERLTPQQLDVCLSFLEERMPLWRQRHEEIVESSEYIDIITANQALMSARYTLQPARIAIRSWVSELSVRNTSRLIDWQRYSPDVKQTVLSGLDHEELILSAILAQGLSREIELHTPSPLEKVQG
jgi:amino acid adenylation domain-containing protein